MFSLFTEYNFDVRVGVIDLIFVNTLLASIYFITGDRSLANQTLPSNPIVLQPSPSCGGRIGMQYYVQAPFLRVKDKSKRFSILF